MREESITDDTSKNNDWYKISEYTLPEPPKEDKNTVRFTMPPAHWKKGEKTKSIRTYRSERLKYYDPKLFNMKFSKTGNPVDRKGKVEGKTEFSTSCSPTEAHPIAFNDAEYEQIKTNLKEFEKTHPENTDTPRILDSLRHRNVWYVSCECICVGCMLPLRTTDLEKNDTCPKCKSNAYTIRNDSYTGEKIGLVPSKNDLHVWPCRVKRVKSQKTRKTSNASSYILSKDTLPLDKGRFGDLPDVLHKMFGNATNINKGSMPKSGSSFVLRCGILEDATSFDDSFLKVIKVLYEENKVKLSYAQFIDIILHNLSNAKQFLRTCEGTLIQQFSAHRHIDTQDFTSWKTTQDDTMRNKPFLKNIYVAYENFKDYLKDTNLEHDHTILWPILCYPGVLWEHGLNLYLIKTDKKTGNSATYVCPSNGESYFYHYGSEHKNNKTAIVMFYEIYTHKYFYEPLARIIPGSKNNKHTFLFQNTDIMNSVYPIRQHCGIVQQDKYVKFLKTNNFFMRPLPYTTSIDIPKGNNVSTILEQLKLKPTHQILNSMYQARGIMVTYEKHSFFIPIQPRSIIPELDILQSIPCVYLANLDTSVTFYTMLAEKHMRTKPIQYTVDLNVSTNDKTYVNGLILETNTIVPVLTSVKPEKTQLVQSEKPMYECDDYEINTEEQDYIKEFNDFWSTYDIFCMEIHKALVENQLLKNIKENVDVAKRTIAEVAKTILQNHKNYPEYLDILLREYEYNFVRREDILHGKRPKFLMSLKDKIYHLDIKTFTDTKSKDLFISNQKRRHKYKKYIPYYNPDNLKVIQDTHHYTNSEKGLKLSKTWQHILHRDFRYMFDNKYEWIEKTSHGVDAKLLQKYYDNNNWNEISKKTRSCVVLMSNTGKVVIHIASDSCVYYLLFYTIDKVHYPVFINKNSYMVFLLNPEDLSTEFFHKIGGNLINNTQKNSKNVTSKSPVQKDPSPIQKDPSPVQKDPSPVQKDPSPVQKDPSPVQKDPSTERPKSCTERPKSCI